MTIIWTAQYSYSGPDRVDITTRRTHPQGAAFAPTWSMVRDYKNGQLSEKAYTQQYWTLMRDSFTKNQSSWLWLLSQMEVTLVCFCPADTFCHRVILARDILDKHFSNATYDEDTGERIPAGRW